MFDYSGPMLWMAQFFHDTTHGRARSSSGIRRVIESVRKQPVDPATLDRARVKMRSALYAILEQFAGFGRANLLASFALFDDDPARINGLEDEFAKVTPDVVRETAQEYLRPGNRTIYAVKPGKPADAGEVESGHDIRSLAPHPGDLCCAALAGSVSAQPKQQPPPAGAPRRLHPAEAGRFTLPNGMPVTLVPFGQVPKVTIRLVLGAGNLHEAEDEVWLADLTAPMREGRPRSPADARGARVRRHGRRARCRVGPDTTSITTEVLADRGAAAQLIADVARARGFRIGARPASRPSSCATCHPDAARRKLSRRRTLPSWSTAITPTAGCSRQRRCSTASRSSRCEAFHRTHLRRRPRAAVRRRRLRRADDGGRHPRGVRIVGARGEADAANPPAGSHALRAPRSAGRAAVDDPARPRVPEPVEQGRSHSRSWTLCSAARLPRASPRTSASRRATPIRRTAPSQRSGHGALGRDRRCHDANTGESLKEILNEIVRLRKEAPPAEELRASRTTWRASSWCRTPRAGRHRTARLRRPARARRRLPLDLRRADHGRHPGGGHRIANDYLTPQDDARGGRGRQDGQGAGGSVVGLVRLRLVVATGGSTGTATAWRSCSSIAASGAFGSVRKQADADRLTR